MTELILCRHRLCLLQRNAVERCITNDADLAMLEAETGDQFGRRFGGHCRRGQQPKARDNSTNCKTYHRLQDVQFPLAASCRVFVLWRREALGASNAFPHTTAKS